MEQKIKLIYKQNKKKFYLMLEIFMIFLIPALFVVTFNSIGFYVILGIYITLRLIMFFFMKKISEEILKNYNSSYERNSIENIIYNVFMSEEEKYIKKKTDHILKYNKK